MQGKLEPVGVDGVSLFKELISTQFSSKSIEII
jgi:hypothetical protein